MEIPDYLNSKLPLLSARVRGEWQKTKIFEVIRGKQIIRDYTCYDGSAKGHLIPFQSKFAAAIWNWQQMSVVNRRWFNARAAKLGLQYSGYNLFISLYMRDKLEEYMGYPDPHHLSHEKGGSDELEVTGLAGSTPFALIGDNVAGRIVRKAFLEVRDGTSPNSITVKQTAKWNGDGFPWQDNIHKGDIGSLIGLNASGYSIWLKPDVFSGDIIAFLGYSIYRNKCATTLSILCDAVDSSGFLNFSNGISGAIVDLTNLVDIGPIYVDMTYLTSG